MRLSLVTPEISNCLRRNPLVGVVGTRVDEATSTCVMLSHGVEAHVTNLVREFGDSGYGDASRWSATLRGGRVFERQGERPKPSSAVTSSEVRWLDLGLSDELSARRSPSRAVELASRELGSLVGAWLELARGGGATLWGTDRASASARWGGVDPSSRPDRAAALERMLKDLGEMPPAGRPSERALWVAALLNPCGADRQAWPVLDIRPAVLTATTPMERLSVAKTGMVDSMYKLKGGSWPMNTYYW